MEYFNLLEFKKEPFSNSPEPEFLFASTQHNTCLQRLELAVRLKRGLNIVIGAIGTGKTTLCRKLIQQLSEPIAGDSPAIDTFLLLDPAVDSRFAFVQTVAGILGIQEISTDDNEWHIKEKIKRFLFDQGVQEQKIVVLVIDEGQKIPDECLEILREFLNYETNSSKLLQIVIFAQPEFRKSLAARENLLDRVNYLCNLKPLSFLQMKAMIEHRISIASLEPSHQSLFTFGGMLAIYCATAGYPRKVVSLCHQVVLMMIIRGKHKAGWFLVRSCARKMSGLAFRRVAYATLSLLVVSVLVYSVVMYRTEKQMIGDQSRQLRVLSGIDFKKELLFSNSHQDGASPQEKMPDYLGTMALKKRMTIWRVLDNIYGDSSDEIKQLFIAANPQIKNVNSTLEGTVIHVPVIPAKAHLLKKGTYVVALESSKDMASVYYSFIKKNDQEMMPTLLFLALWDKNEGRRFIIALDKQFVSMEEAKEAIRRLPSGLAVSAQVLSQGDGNTVSFNSKYFRN